MKPAPLTINTGAGSPFSFRVPQPLYLVGLVKLDTLSNGFDERVRLFGARQTFSGHEIYKAPEPDSGAEQIRRKNLIKRATNLNTRAWK